MNVDEFKAWLQYQGFHIAGKDSDSFNQCRWYAYRRSLREAAPCECNFDKQGMQIVVYPALINHIGQLFDSVEVELTGEHKTWWQFRAYGMTFAEFVEKHDEIEADLIYAWNGLHVLKEKS